LETLNHKVNPFNPGTGLENARVDLIDNFIALIENPGYGSIENDPVKINQVIVIICVTGTMKGTLNLRRFTAKAPCLFIVLTDQILQNTGFSDDFSGHAIIMAKEFWNDFPVNIQLSFPFLLSVHDNPWIPLSNEELASIAGYFHLIQSAIRKRENPNRIETVRYLTLGFFYGYGYQFHKINENPNKSKQDILTERFLTLVKDNCRMNRNIEFYADKVCLTHKYLSKAIKINSGKTAAEWIEDYVILEAKALLKSTNKTVQQISDELNFPTQSFFGKYFKRRVGMSPKKYRNSS
jgi:AraC family transcriptional activator of pobA